VYPLLKTTTIQNNAIAISTMQVCAVLSNASHELQQLGLSMQAHWTHAQLQCDESRVTVCLGRNFHFGIALTGAQAVVQSMPGNNSFGTMYQREIPVQTVYELECFLRGEMCRQLLHSLSLVYDEVIAKQQQQHQHSNGAGTAGAATAAVATSSRVAVHEYSGVMQLWQNAHAAAATQNGHSNGITAANSSDACTLAVVVQPVTSAASSTTTAAAKSGIGIVCSVRRDSVAHKALQHHADTNGLLLDHTMHSKKAAIQQHQQQQHLSDADQYSVQLHWQQLQGRHVLEQFKTLFSIVLAAAHSSTS
jgi:hypothetical protein